MDAGELVIKTIIDNRDVGKDVNRLKQQLKQEEKSLKEFLTYKVQLETETGSLEEVEQALKDIEKLQKQGLTEVEIEDVGTVNLEQHKQDLIYTRDLYKQINSEIDDSIGSIKQLNVALASEQMKQNIKDVGKEIDKNIKSIGKMALAIFGIRSAYMMVRSAINDISKSNKDVANTLQYAKSMMSTALEPVVIRIVDWLKQALAYINALVKAWFKRDIFAETNANLKKANKQASDLKKTLTGFDEMNILNSTSTGGGGGISSSDLGLPTVEQTGIFGWILENKDKVIAGIGAITTALLGVKLFALDPLNTVLYAILSYGIIYTVESIVGWLADPTWENFGKILEGIGITMIGIATLLAVGGAISTGLGVVIGLVGGLVGGIGFLIEKLEKNKEAVHDVQKAEEDLATSRKDRRSVEKQYADAIKRQEQAHKDLKKAQEETGISGEELYRKVQANAEIYSTFSDEEKKVYDAYLNELIAIDSVTDAKKNLSTVKEKELYDDLKTQISNDETGDSYDKLKNKIILATSQEELSIEHAQDLISRMLSDMSLEAEKTFLADIPESIKEGLKPSKYDSTIKRFQRSIKDAFKQAFSFSGNFSLNLKSGILGAKGLMLYPKSMPKLAVGGIVNQPGRGVPYNGAIIGERGAEAVVPLTDTQQMELLGATIGRYITIQNTNPIYLNGRLIAKEINQANNESDFAYNR